MSEDKTGKYDCKHFGLFDAGDYGLQDGCELLGNYCDYAWLGGAQNCDYFEDKYESNGCFMTSACVDYLGKEDDCYELEMIRKFRDEKLRYIPGGKAMIKEYYEVAPGIVKAINASKEKSTYYQDIYDTILHCIDNIKANDNNRAVALYLGMFYKYKELFNL